MRTMRLAAFVLAFFILYNTCSAKYEVRYFDCYLVGLYGVFDGDKMVSQPYGAAAVPQLDTLAKKWNRKGFNLADERKMQVRLKRQYPITPLVGKHL